MEQHVPDHMKGLPSLQYTMNSPAPNWQEFKEALFERMSSKYADLAAIFKTGDYPEEPLPEEPADLQTPEGRIYLSSINEIGKKRVQNEHNKKLMYADLWLVLPRLLKDVLTAKEDHERCVAVPFDLKALWIRVGALATAGVSRMAALNQLEHAQRFATLKQRQDESLAAFKTRVKRDVEMFFVLGMPEPDPDHVVLTFLNGALDDIYGEAKRNLKYLMSEGISNVPGSLEDA